MLISPFQWHNDPCFGYVIQWLDTCVFRLAIPQFLDTNVKQARRYMLWGKDLTKN